MDLGIFAWGHAVGLAERAVESGVVGKTALLPYLCDRLSGKNAILAEQQPHLYHILVIRDVHILLEQVGQVILVGEEHLGDRVEGEVACKIVADISQKIGQHTVARGGMQALVLSVQCAVVLGQQGQQSGDALTSVAHPATVIGAADGVEQRLVTAQSILSGTI